MKRANWISVFLLLLISFLFLWTYYGDVIIKPNRYLLNQNGDAIKNYFTYASHIKENSIINSKIMNYPYGENFMYLDCQPVLTIIIKLLSVPFPEIVNYSIGIINLLMIFSLVFTSLFLYLILRELKINNFLSVTGGFSIAVLAPQIFRITGHLALSYSFVIPLTWLLLIRFLKSDNKLKWSIILMINSLFWFFVHAYLGMIATSFVLLYLVFNLVIYDRHKAGSFHQYLYIAIQGIIPMILFWMFISISDQHIGRTDNQYGFLVYVANIYSVFLPNHPPLNVLFKDMNLIQDWEGWSYIGIGSLLFIILFVINRITRIFTHNSIADDKPFLKNKIIIPAIFSSVIMLLISMGYPFKWNMEYLLDWFSIIKSFRGIGRFSWVFYYVITISAVYFMYLIYETHGKKIFLLLPFLLVSFSYIIEGIPYHSEMGKLVNQHTNSFNPSNLSQSISNGLRFMDKKKYQAVIPLPYYHIGSESFGKSATDKIYSLSMIMSYHSEIPLMSNYSTRTSILESKNLVQVLSPPFYNKTLAEDTEDKRPFLVLFSKEDLSDDEKGLLARCTELYQDENYALFEIPYSSLFENNSNEIFSQFHLIRSNLIEKNSFLTTSDSTFIAYNSFEDSPADTTYRGKGALRAMKKNYNLLLKTETTEMIKNKDYIASFWMYNDGYNFGQGVLNSITVIQCENKGGEVQWISMVNPRYSCVIDNSWSLVELTFKVPDWASDISVIIKGDDESTDFILVDDILIREKSADVYKIQPDSSLFYNNHTIHTNTIQTH